MSGPDEQAALQSDLFAVLSAFCGDDAGRSVTFRSRRPFASAISIRGSEARPAASVMKVALAMAVFRNAALGQVDLASRVPVRTFSPTRYVSILSAFDPESTLSVREVCRLALVTSDNPLAVHLQGLADFDAVNRLLAEVGCRPPCRMAAGFSEDELGVKNRVNVLTADDAVRLMSVVRDDPRYCDLALALKNNLRNNRMPALLPEHVAVIHKTGTLEGVANDVGIVQDERVEFIAAFLTDNQPDPIGTSNDIARCTLGLFDRLSAG